MKKTTIWTAALTAMILAGCQGRPSENPPIHMNPNMDHQPKYKAQSESEFFENHSTMRMSVEGTVARGQLRGDDAYYTGRDAKGNVLETVPVSVTMNLLKRGQERYNIFCTPCHGETGNGKGIVGQKMPIPPTNLHEARLLPVGDGHLFDVMTNGIRNMQNYRSQISVADRWAIVSYVRALQKSQLATMDDVPQEKRKDLK